MPTRLLVLAVALAAPAVAREKPPRTSPAARKAVLDADAEARAAIKKPLPEGKRKLPSATASGFDWITVLGLTPVHAQHGKPSCVAQATVAALEWNWQIRNGTPQKPVLSPQPVVDRLDQPGGLNYADVLDQLLLRGVAPLTDYPYTGDPRPAAGKATTRYRIVGWGRVGGKAPPTVDELKAALLEHGPLVIGIHSTPAFQKYRGGVFAERAKDIPANDPTNHALVLLGWDDKKGAGGCWHVQNSWGLKWGDAGGGWVEYGSNNVGRLAYWLRAQGTQYPLPADAHERLGGSADPFPKWVGGKP